MKLFVYKLSFLELKAEIFMAQNLKILMILLEKQSRKWKIQSLRKVAKTMTKIRMVLSSTSFCCGKLLMLATIVIQIFQFKKGIL
jgi:hypothetical protein